MKFFVLIQKEVPNPSCVIEMQEMYFSGTTGELTAITKIKDGVKETRNPSCLKQLAGPVICEEGLIKSLKNVTVQDDAELKSVIEKHQSDRCVFSKFREVKDSEIRVPQFNFCDPIQVIKAEIWMRTAITYRANKTKTAAIPEGKDATTPAGGGLFASKILVEEVNIAPLSARKLG